MAKKAQKSQTSKGLTLKIVNPNAAGIDVASTEMQVCVPADRDADNNRRFGSFTKDLREISSYLSACGIDTVAMESTGVYWLLLYMLLKEDGFDVILVNARDVKSYSEKKSDECDAEWLMLLHSYGLLKSSFQPENLARNIRNLSRHRDSHLQQSSRAVQHMQKAMDQMNVKLTNVISDITGKSGQAIIHAILSGERNPQILVSLADSRCKSTPEVIADSLDGTWDADHLFELKQSLQAYMFFQEQAQECDRELETLMVKYSANVEVESLEFIPTKKRIAKKMP